MARKIQPVLIVGGGWAGLSAALLLIENSIPVTLLEAAPQLGGRARTVRLDDLLLDNGQHLMLGAYHTVAKLLDNVEINQSQVLLRTPLSFSMRSGTQPSSSSKTVQLIFGFLPMLLSLAQAQGITLFEKFKIMQFFYTLQKQKFTITPDISVSLLLKNQGQSDHVIQFFWAPLCLAALSTPPDQASAQVFMRILQDVFMGKRTNTDFIFAKKSLSEIFPEPATHKISRLGGKIITHQRVTQLIIENNICTGIKTTKDIFMGSHIILATPPQVTHNIINHHPSLNKLTQALAQFTTESITTVYLQYPHHVTLNTPMVGLINTLSQWVFDRQFAQQPGLIAVIITGQGPHTELDNTQLGKKIAHELHVHFEHFPPEPINIKIIREKQGAFACTVGINDHRSDNKTSLPGLWLAGDYTNTGYPASLESALQSGLRCAELIIDNMGLNRIEK